MEIGSEKSFRVLSAPIGPFVIKPLTSMNKYVVQPIIMAPFISESGAPRVIGVP